MKKSLFTLVVFIYSITIINAQTLFVANNNPGAATGVNVFTGSSALQNAHGAASDNDIIYVVPSQVSYGTLTITKEVTIFGIGLRPVKDLGTKSEVTMINLNSSNVRLSGLTIRDDVNVGISLSNTSLTNLSFENCRIGRIEMGSSNSVTVSNLLARNNVFTGYGSVATSFLLYVTSNVTITNNVIYTSCCTAASMRVTGATISYNVFVSDGNRGVDANVINNTFDHNIFYGVNVSLLSSSTGNVWTNNLSFGGSQTVFGTGSSSNGTISGNIENMDPLLTSVPITYTWIDSHDFTLLPGSPALASDPLNMTSEDMGIYGGPTPFDDEGNLLPLIQSITIPATIPLGSNLPVTIKAKGN